MAVLPRYISAGNRPVDGPLLDGGRSAVVLFELEQYRSWLWVVFQIVMRTVRSLGMDGPPPVENYGTETPWFLCVLTGEWRTVRPWDADSPPLTSGFSQRCLQIGVFGVLNRGWSAPRVWTVRPRL